MISFEHAFDLVMKETLNFGIEIIPLTDCTDRVLAENVLTDRDFPPYNRATKDGIAITNEAIVKGLKAFEIIGKLPAGNPPLSLTNVYQCIEIMTGAVVPEGTAVVMYEETEMDKGVAKVLSTPKPNQNIHFQGSDHHQGEEILAAGTIIGPGEIGALAAIGQTMVKVQKRPRIAIITTGDELVEVDQTPSPHQIRKSNGYTLQSALSKMEIGATMYHLPDQPFVIEQKLATLIHTHDVWLLSGGVSKGKYDYLPSAFDLLDFVKLFHGVNQRPGKTFWFGKHEETGTLVFAFPGNPVSTYACFLTYFKPLLLMSMGLEKSDSFAQLAEPFKNKTDLTCFLPFFFTYQDGQRWVNPKPTNGSGDLLSLTGIDGFFIAEPDMSYKQGDLVDIRI